MAKTLGIDIGTTSVSALLFDSDSALLVQKASRSTNAFVSGLASGAREQDCGLILACLRQVLVELAGDTQKPLKVDAISLTGQMHSFLFLDKSGQPCSNLITWQDERALQQSPTGKSWFAEFCELQKQSSDSARGMHSRAGDMGVILYMFAKQNKIPATARHIVMLHDWLAGVLLGNNKKYFTDPSFAQSSGLLSEQLKCWDEELITRLGLDMALFSRITEPARCIGKTVASLLPLLAGIPVYTGMGDNQASVLGSLKKPEESILLNVGTGGQISLVIDKFESIPGLDTRILFADKYLISGCTQCSGRAYAMLVKLIKQIGQDVFAAVLSENDIYKRLESICAPQTNLICEPRFSGTVTNPDIRGSIENISENNFSLADLTCAFLVGIINEFHLLYGKMGKERKYLVGSGNGFRNNVLLRKQAERKFGKELVLPDFSEEAAFGVSLCAAVGLGVYPSLCACFAR